MVSYCVLFLAVWLVQLYKSLNRVANMYCVSVVVSRDLLFSVIYFH